MKIIEQLAQSIRKAAAYNPDAQAAPFSILWPDKDRQWEAVVPKLQGIMPELFVLGEYAPAERRGPAIWLRCVLADNIEGLPEVGDRRPVFYPPGVSRQDLRAVDQCPDVWKPLAELQHRSVLWSQVNARDWTILAWFMTAKGGLGLDVAQDRESVQALQSALPKLLDEEVASMQGKHINKAFCTELLAGADPVRELLRWMNEPEAYKATRTSEEWHGFVDYCTAKFSLDPDNDGVLTAAERLAAQQGSWSIVWNRFRETPDKYRAISGWMRSLVLPLLADATVWPQLNEEEERQLRHALLHIETLSPASARQEIERLEVEHGKRRNSIWADLGEAPLAQSLQLLVTVADITAKAVAGNVNDMERYYVAEAWRADNAVLQVLATITKPDDVAAVTAAIRAAYLPWLMETAQTIQSNVRLNGYPGGDVETVSTIFYPPGECVLFVDGLRFDLAMRLGERFCSIGLSVEQKPYWTGLPTVTPTGKPIRMPIRNELCGDKGNIEFEPAVAETNQVASFARLKKLLENKGWLVQPEGMALADHAWIEATSIDKVGHDAGWKLAKQVDELLTEIYHAVISLLDAGWKRIRIVSDHGWLLMPGGLPKLDLPASLADNKWGRCAMIKPGAKSAESLYPWYWNPQVQVALPAGISCYRSGMEYSHGGLSLQECLLLELIVGKPVSAQEQTAIITGAVWKGLRCRVYVEGAADALTVDLRLKPGNASSTILAATKLLDEQGQASVMVENEDYIGQSATVVLINSAGCLVAQLPTIVGGE